MNEWISLPCHYLHKIKKSVMLWYKNALQFVCIYKIMNATLEGSVLTRSYSCVLLIDGVLRILIRY